MKRGILLLTFLTILINFAKADSDKSIEFNQLPLAAKEFIEAYFPEKEIALSKMETDIFDKNYDVIFVNGDKIEFNKKGEWTEIKCKYSEVPSAIIPSQILNYISTHYKDVKVISIEKERKGYEVELNNGIELKFNKKFEPIKIEN